MTRVRYTESDGVLVSKPLLAVDKLVIVTLDTVRNMFFVTQHSDGTVLVQGEGVDTALLKKKAKNALKDLGVVFQDEVRTRKGEAQ